MNLEKKSNVPFHFAYRSGGKYLPLALTDKERSVYRKEENKWRDEDSREDLKKLTAQRAEKPRDFLVGERKARLFIRNIGFYGAKGTRILHFIAEDEATCNDLMGEGAYGDTYAVYDSQVGIIVPNHTSERILSHGGSEGIATVLVHELTHAAESRSGLHSITRIYDKNERDWTGYMSRNGLVTVREDSDVPLQGMFLSEALAAHVHGLYVRRLKNPFSLLNSITNYPGPHKPAFYDSFVPPMKDSPVAAGHDAYSMEMLSWKAHEIGATDTLHRLIEALYATARTDPGLQLKGLRAIPRIINSVQPGLYNELRNVPHEKQAFIDTMNRTYDIVSR